MTKIIWTLNATKDLEYWKKYDIKKYKRIKLLVKNIQETPFSGIGKPEPLKYSMTNLWSRRITHEHRLVYSIDDIEIIIYSCRFHYKK
ncbi:MULTISPECIES: Txe/YoeB family addiction module toxin [unclassified Rickettsia]|uniref:Txe/YoeB family addiction module toxin n=1 Tax=unclassified Rickettsia TaxID=114295 RepID=UPI0031330EF0